MANGTQEEKAELKATLDAKRAAAASRKTKSRRPAKNVIDLYNLNVDINNEMMEEHATELATAKAEAA